MFDLDAFIDDCTAAVDGPEPEQAVRQLIERAVAASAVERALPAERSELVVIHRSLELTILKVIWGPGMRLSPHDHRMWAAIGVYGGIEDNSFFIRSEEGIAPSGGTRLETGSALVLDDKVIHSVANPSASEFTGAIHVYGGDFVATPRSMWDPITLDEESADLSAFKRLFEQSNSNARD